MDADVLVARYEGLRAQVLAGLGRGWGRHLLLRQGMKTWMSACSPGASEAPGWAQHKGCRVEGLPGDVRGEVVGILAGMALHSQKEKRG